MREYETVFVLHPSMGEQEVEAEIQAIQDLITAGAGTIEEVEKWGRRRLAYQIQKVHEGTYTLIRFKSEAQVLKDIERRYRLNERLLRHMTIISEGPPAPQRPEYEGEPRDRRGRDDGDFEVPRRTPPYMSPATPVPAPSGPPPAPVTGPESEPEPEPPTVASPGEETAERTAEE